MNLLGRFRVIIYLLVLISITAFAAAEQDMAVLLVAAGTVAMSWWLVDRPGGHAVPRRLINFGVLLTSLLFFYEIVLSPDHSGNLLLSLGPAMIAILMCKMFEAKVSRDYTEIFALTLLIIVAGAIFGTSLLFGILLIAYMVIGVAGIALFFLHREETRMRPAAQRVQPAAPIIRRDIRRVTSISAFILVLFAMMVFLVFPRGRGRAMLAPWAVGRVNPQTGFSDQVHFGEFGALAQSDAIVMEVRLEEGGAPIGSSSLQPYFRGMTLDTYDRHGWKRSESDPGTEDDYLLDPGEHQQLVQRRPDANDPPCYDTGMLEQHYTFHAGANNNHVLFGIFPPVAFESADIHSITLDRRDLMINYHGQTGDRFDYDVESPLVYRGGVTTGPEGFVPGEPSDSDSPQPRHAIPTRIVTMAHQLAGDLDPGSRPLTPELTLKLARRFEIYLRTHYPYSLKMGTVDFSIDPTEDFLFNRQRTGGHCEYFASAMILLCRSLGIQARMVTGYHGGEYNEVGGYYLVRQKFAHAWVEVYDGKRQGWVSFDPSPASAGQFDETSWSHWFSQWSEYLQSQWLSGIVFFDNASRQQVIDFVKVTLWQNVVALCQWAAQPLHSLAGPGRAAARAAALALLAASIFLSGWLVKRILARRRSDVARMLRNVDPAARQRLARQLGFFDRLVALLRRAGVRRTPAQTPRELADALARPAHDDASWLVDQFYALRFGAAQMTATLRQQVEHRLAHLEKLTRSSKHDDQGQG